MEDDLYLRCVICGKEMEKSQFSNAPLCSEKCFSKHYWNKLLKEKDEHIIIHGKCYYDAGNVENPDNVSFLGCSGQRFWIRFFDGREITTNNLWCQGEIPEAYIDDLPDTAEFFWPENDT